MSELQLLGDRYELGEVIGRGGMAEVRRGRDTRLGRIVALKMLRVDHSTDATFQARFRREAQSAASLNHRNIVAVYDTGEDMIDGHRIPYIVMEYVEGQTLREMVRDQVRFLPERSIEVLSATLDALDYSHRAGIVHRDIKPGNIMITTTGEVKVMDFGIARSLADTGMALTQTAAVVGTAQYISPEQARGEQADARSDLYACGCVLYELLTGRPPFIGESLVSVAVSHVREYATPPSALDPSIPPELDAIVMKALAKGRDERYQSAYEMRADLQRAAAGLPVAAYADTSAATQLMAGGAPVYDETQVAGEDTLEGDEIDEDDEAKGVSWWAVALGSLAVLAIAGLVGFLIFRNSGGPPMVTVPSLTGETREVAEEMLTDRGLVPAIDSQETNDADQVGTVLSQDPPPNEQLEEGSTVTIAVGVEPDMVIVPSVVGRTQEEAEAMIQEEGLNVGNVSREDSDRPEGEVLETDPEGGASVEPDSTVNLTVSTGVQEIEVPGLVGESRESAEAELDRRGLNVQVITEPADAPEGQVFRQSPEEGSSIDEGGTVIIWVAEQPEDQGDGNEGGDGNGDGNGNGNGNDGGDNGGGGDQGDDTGTDEGTDNGGGDDTGTDEGTDNGGGDDTGTDEGTDNGGGEGADDGGGEGSESDWNSQTPTP
ncbi:Stk1 family PASTA domain-containing Ser/Thr kinase [Phytoactinopolyspora halotolerans]|uniref:non-specific serine/threonine protein kinase n=1 Tax=Phytoactinopolyspora halotolerans TaxID=1981512 RepID=A0A6L9S416_9ACTN|nr:Stk1 family PASTA domain-containing Ser/Thr kinase [Phytoactinopolyspora halotolerans]NED98719.1 Stk1 family PASTA domain-containing Ser/Thr kinase [Phytoactinopolyspora halotolerans]